MVPCACDPGVCGKCPTVESKLVCTSMECCIAAAVAGCAPVDPREPSRLKAGVDEIEEPR